MSTFSSVPPSSTHVIESAVIKAPISKVWGLVSSLDFSWWSLVTSSTLSTGASSATVGSTFSVAFKDGVRWTIQLQELSQINHSLTFEVITCEPASSVSSVVHTISLKRVTSDNSTFVEWVSDFSNDATVEIVSDSSFKRAEAFRDLAATAGA